MKLAALCCTYLRPHTLGQLIESFLRQDYPARHRELIILDDAGQYRNQEGDGWRLISIARRFRTLGEKRNACAALASPDVEGFLVADDDDIYLPHWFSTQAQALKQAEWSRPSLVLSETATGLRESPTEGLYHASWAFRRKAFDRVRGYGPVNNGEDQEFAARLVQAGVKICDPCQFAPPFFLVRYHNQSYHVSDLDDRGYAALQRQVGKPQETVHIHWPKNFTELPVQRWYSFGPAVNSSDGGRPVELIGPVHGAGANGPQNGMSALQAALRKRIDSGLDWLSIRPLPASQGALPWFWNWGDRSYAAWWARQGEPFVQGPNMLFMDSHSPRIDADECTLLDAPSCRAMFCHSAWYRDHIAAHRRATNVSPIELWPYPISPWPGEPLPAKYDLLIYAKNGHRPQLLEHLATLYPRHLQIHYGHYQREQLFQAARQSRACAYLADDDHGPLALQEILLAGCPTVGVRTAAAFVQSGENGFLVRRLPPGASCIQTEDDGSALAEYLLAITQAQALDRHQIRAMAVERFSTERIVDTVLRALNRARVIG
ncbi:glycosyltransferase [Planctomicrobium sp. SH527]|uniref:glycosyltransferase n=1 Tax=Planctomicrobium sp. SH527 TaxID=3448123 RepID=UPI003F5B3D76